MIRNGRDVGPTDDDDDDDDDADETSVIMFLMSA